jgi:hypothetical protein
MRAYSIFYRSPYGQDSWHQFSIASVSPNFVPEVKFNGRQIPRENIDYGFGEFRGEDTLPTIPPNAEVQMEVKYRDITGGNIRVAWGKPDKKTASFVYVGIYAECYDGYYYSDTIITDIENVTEVSMPLGTICTPITNPVGVFALGAVVNFYGPWYGSKDNIKGIKGQYYGGIGVDDTTIWFAS